MIPLTSPSQACRRGQSSACARNRWLFYQILCLRKLAVVQVHVPLRGTDVCVAQQAAGEFDPLLPADLRPAFVSGQVQDQIPWQASFVAGVLPFGLDQYPLVPIAATIAWQFIGVLASAKTSIAASIWLILPSCFATALAFAGLVCFAFVVALFFVLVAMTSGARGHPASFR